MTKSLLKFVLSMRNLGKVREHLKQKTNKKSVSSIARCHALNPFVHQDDFFADLPLNISCKLEISTTTHIILSLVLAY